VSTSRHRLGDLCTLTRGTSPTLRTEAGPYPLVVTAAFRRTADHYQLEGPTVCIPLISSTGHGDAALHRVHYQDGKFALANLLVGLQPKDGKQCDAKYLYYLLTAKKDELFVPLMLGTANVSLKERDIAYVEVPLPPLPEQRRIVDRVEALASRIAEAKCLRQAACAESESLAVSRISEVLTGGWPEDRLDAIVDSARPITYGIVQAGEHDPNGIPYIRVSDMAKPRLTLEGMLRTSPTIAAKYQRSMVISGDLVFAI
jgi:hypothetical protein